MTEIEHKNETLSFLKTLVEDFNSPKLTYLTQKSTQEIRFIPEYLDEEKKSSIFSRKVIEKIGEKPSSEKEHNLKRSIYLEFNNDKPDLYLNLVINTSEYDGNNFFELAKEINKLNDSKIFNSLKKSCNQNYYHIHKIKLLSSSKIAELESNKDTREDKLKEVFKIYVPIMLGRLQVLFPDPF